MILTCIVGVTQLTSDMVLGAYNLLIAILRELVLWIYMLCYDYEQICYGMSKNKKVMIIISIIEHEHEIYDYAVKKNVWTNLLCLWLIKHAMHD